jgi:hypothetical protein
MDFAKTVLGQDDDRLDRVRREVDRVLGSGALVDAAAVICNFNAIDRVADATGIPLDKERVGLTADFRAELGIDAFAEGKQRVS